MTNIRMLGQISGTRDGEPWPAPGDTIDLPEDEAKNLIATGIAAKAEDVPMVAKLGEMQTRTDSSKDIPVGGMVWNNELHSTEADLVRRPDANSDTVANVGTASEHVINAREDTREAMENAVTPSRSKSKTMTNSAFKGTTETTSTESQAEANRAEADRSDDTAGVHGDERKVETAPTADPTPAPKAGRSK